MHGVMIPRLMDETNIRCWVGERIDVFLSCDEMYIQTARGRFGEKDVDCTSTIPLQHADVLQDIEEARVNGAFPEVS
jgi:hypothetical protein